MNKLKYTFLSLFFMFPVLLLKAQSGSIKKAEEPTDFMRSDGKIYVVVAVIIVILCGLFLYLNNLDKKILKLEKNAS